MKNYNEIPCFKIPIAKQNNHGIYCIIRDKDIYIGSTTVGFRNRFRHHYKGNNKMKHTYDLLHNNGNFYMLCDMTNIKDEYLVREVEQLFIDYFKDNKQYNLINKKEETTSTVKKRDKKPKYKNIKIDKNDYDRVIKILNNNGINYKMNGDEQNKSR